LLFGFSSSPLLREREPIKQEMWNLSREKLVLVVQNYYDIILVLFLSIGLTYLASRAWKRATNNREDIPGRLGLPLIGETFSLLSATNSTRGCYDFVRLRRLW
jgi:hypothetical protein